MFDFFRRRKRQFTPDDQLPYVTAPAGKQPIELQSLEIEVVVTGLLAETNQTLRFHNPNGRQLEGNLTFPLPDHAVVCGYALDVDGELVDGVVVTKKEARRILEAEERKGADPGVMEQAQGNVYRTRIYPIPAKGSRTIRITYVSPLTVEGNAAAYHLPLAHASSIQRVGLEVAVVQAPTQPEISGGLGNLQLAEWEDRWVAKATLGKGTPAEDLQIRLPKLPPHFSAVERCGDASYFQVSSTLQETGHERWTPKRIAVAWDASGSRAGVEREQAFLNELLSNWSEVVVDLCVFRDEVDADRRSFDMSKGERDALLKHLEEIPYDGGTHLAALDLSTVPHEDCEAWLVFSDGLATVGRGLPKRGGVRVFTINGQASSNSALLELVSSQAGGIYLNLLRTEPRKAADMLPSYGEALQVAEATGCADLHVARQGGRLSIFGRLKEGVATVQLRGPGAPAAPLVIEAGGSQGRNLARAWAGLQAQVVNLTEHDPKPELVRLGRTFGLVTPGTSLLVLETLEQHLEHGVEPAETRERMRAQYLERVAKKGESKRKAEEKQIEAVLSLWRARVEWWERDFQTEYRRKKEARKEMSGMRGAESFEDAFGAAPASAFAEPAMAGECLDDLELSCDEAPMPMPAPAAAPPRMRRSRAMGGRAGGSPAAKKSQGPASAAASIKIKAWTPDTPYLKRMQGVVAEEAYGIYLQERAAYCESPAFFLDCGDYLITQGQQRLGIRVLSNLVEMGLDDPALMRRYAWRMQQAEELDRAVEVFEKVRSQRDDEPQSHRDLGLALGRRWEKGGEAEDVQRAMELLYDVVLKEWDRFPEIEIIALMELNRLIHMADQRGVAIPERIDSRLRKHLDLDVRISMSWDADLTDVDLHVFEPTGEHAYYGHNRTEIGGLVSRDFTQGYGPEEYVLRRAEPGTYVIKTKYYGSSQQTLCGACTVIVNVFTNYGRPDEKKQVLTLRLDEPGDQILVGEITIDGRSETTEPSASGSGETVEAWQEAFKNLEKGMTVDQVTEVVGQPTRITGSGGMTLVYEHLDGPRVEVGMSPGLVSVQRFFEGAILDLI